MVIAPCNGPLNDAIAELGIPVSVRRIIHWIAGRDAQKNRFQSSLKFMSGLKARVWALAHYIERNRIDLVYTNTVTCIEGALAARATGRPHIWHLREHVAGNKDIRALLPAAAVSRIVGLLSDRVIVNSRVLADEYGCGALKGKISVVYNGIALERFRLPADAGVLLRRELGIKYGTKLVVTIGSITPRKGHAVFVDAAAALRNIHRDVAFVVVGNGDPSLMRQLRARVEMAGLQDAFFFLGWREDIDRILAAADLLILTAEQEAFGRTIVEAMAAGVPVVATRCGGPEEIVLDGETGLLVPVNDAESIAAAAARVLSDSELTERFSTAGRARAEALFSLGTYVQSIENIVSEVTDARR
jgi:glycosyltransferase involved in cell wall biosynthesis